jgi:protein-S-isoprenylcysteine O-methyltransferase Ste14
MNSKLLSLIGFLAAIAALVVLYGRHALLASEPIAVGVQVTAAVFFVWARLTMGWRSFHATANPMDRAPLVTRGPYRLVRHPIYASLWWFVWAGVADHLTPLNVLCAVVIAAGLLLRMVLEERLLTERYPEYREYSKRTRRIVPFVV